MDATVILAIALVHVRGVYAQDSSTFYRPYFQHYRVVTCIVEPFNESILPTMLF